jgi:hypothetical protein
VQRLTTVDKTDLERITDGLAQGDGAATITDADGNDRSYNLVGAVNEMTAVFDEMEKYDLAWGDLTAEQQNAVGRGQEALQYHMSELGPLLASFTGNDGTVTLSDGRVIDLPNAATDATQSGDFPQL